VAAGALARAIPSEAWRRGKRTGYLRRQLKPMFETRVHRTVYPIAKRAHVIELAIDRGKIDTGVSSFPLCELELELKRGNEADLFSVARELVHVLPARLALKSKSERGYELIDEELGAPVRAGPIDLTVCASTRDGFKMIGGACLKQVIDNEPAIIKGDPEGVHHSRASRSNYFVVGDSTSGVIRVDAYRSGPSCGQEVASWAV